MTSNDGLFLGQNFLFTSKEENSELKAIDFGLSDFVKPGIFGVLLCILPAFQSVHFGLG